MKLSPHEHLSGSVIATACNMNPYKTFTDLIIEKRGDPININNLQIEMGIATEETTINAGLKMLGLDPKNKFQFATEHPKKHDEIPLYYTDDGLIDIENLTIETDASKHIYVMNEKQKIKLDGIAIIEAKFTTASPMQNFMPPLWRGVMQLQAGMMCHGVQQGLLFTNYSGRFITAHIYQAHYQSQELIAETVLEFEKHMKENTLPEAVTPTEAAVQFSDSIKDAIDLDDKARKSIQEIQKSEKKIKECKEVIDQHQTKLMKMMGKNEIGNYYDMDSGSSYMIKWPTRNYKPKPAVHCPQCNYELEAAADGYAKRQSKINIKEMNDE